MNTFVRRYDHDADGRLLYSDFCDAFTPFDQYHAQVVNNRQSNYVHRNISVFQFFTPETREVFFRCLKIIFEMEESIELVKKRMTKRPKFNLTDTFDHLDNFEQGSLYKENFKKLLMDNKHYATDTEIAMLFNRFDKNRNGRINFQEFTEEVMPKNSFASD